MIANESLRDAHKSAITVVDFEPKHLEMIKPQETQMQIYNDLPPNFSEFVTENGIARTILDEEGEVVSVCGVFLESEEVGVSWAVHSDLFKKHVIDVTRAVREFFSTLKEKLSITKVTGSVGDDIDGGHRWMQLLRLTFTHKIDTLSFYERIL